MSKDRKDSDDSESKASPGEDERDSDYSDLFSFRKTVTGYGAGRNHIEIPKDLMDEYPRGTKVKVIKIPDIKKPEKKNE